MVGPKYCRKWSDQKSTEGITTRNVRRTNSTLAPGNNVERCASPDQATGGVTPGGGGTCLTNVRNISPTTPSGTHTDSPILPPGRSTRTNSPAALAWSGANMTPNVDSTTSKESSRSEEHTSELQSRQYL